MFVDVFHNKEKNNVFVVQVQYGIVIIYDYIICIIQLETVYTCYTDVMYRQRI